MQKLWYPFVLSIMVTAFAGATVPAAADSFCGYEAGLIGTRGIGYVTPYSAAESDADYDYETKTCRVPVYSSPNATAYRLIDCLEIEAFPTPYHSNEVFVTGLLENGFPVTFSDYFAFLIYDLTPQFEQVQLHSGPTGWIKSRHGLGGNVYHPDHVVGVRGQTTSDQFFEKPDYSSIASAPDIHGPIAQEFLERLFDDIGKPIEIPENEWNWYITSGRDDYYYGFTYQVTDVKADESGALWYVVDEYLTIDALARSERHAELQELLDGPMHGPYSSPVIRSVHIPFRDSSGMVQSVFLPGPYCD